MKVLTSQQIRQLDAFTIEEESITSIDLMERASLAFVKWFVEEFSPEGKKIAIICGTGNNGGDGLAIARMLYYRFYNISIYQCAISEEKSPDYLVNFNRLPRKTAIPIIDLKANEDLPQLEEFNIIIDAILGSGLNRPVEAFWGQVFDYINSLETTIVSIDLPTGLFADKSTSSPTIKADHTFSFELPKLAFFFAENQTAVGQWHFASIGLSKVGLADAKTLIYYVDAAMIKAMYRRRKRFSHKGTFGHALLIMGSYGKVGAALLAARACLRSGTGLVTVHAPQCAYSILQMGFPEAMVSVDQHEYYFTDVPDLENYKAIGIGCGMNTKLSSIKGLKKVLEKASVPLVLDADALNILAQEKSLLDSLPKGSILTPHPGEFIRLFGASANDFDRNKLQLKQAKALGVYIILKGANTCIATPEGACYFNSTGNPGMATAGSGDVLTGIITGLLAQGYQTKNACLMGVYIHGLAGDLSVQHYRGQEALLASDIIDHLGNGFLQISKNVN